MVDSVKRTFLSKHNDGEIFLYFKMLNLQWMLFWNDDQQIVQFPTLFTIVGSFVSDCNYFQFTSLHEPRKWKRRGLFQPCIQFNTYITVTS